MEQFHVSPVGKIRNNGEEVLVQVEPRYIPALQALDGFSHLNVLWWFHEFDDAKSRSVLEALSPYKNSPDIMGIFSTRSPIRPNPIALSTAKIISIDHSGGVIRLAYIDANDNTPVLDLKPYTPSLDKIENPTVPNWCSHWPKSAEQSADFDWENEFNF